MPDPFDRFLRRPLEDILVTQGLLTKEKAAELAAAATTAAEPLSVVLLEAGTMTAWDLARLVATHYQMPVQPLIGYRYEKELAFGLKAEILHRYQVLPLGVFGNTRTFAIAEPPSRALLDELTATCGTSLFFFVSEAPDIAKVLRDHVKVVDSSETGWQRLFDSAEQEVAKGLTTPKAKTHA